ncbi:uncharacterized protein MELLADRAFT_62834 [Melampsora larici-populina 98AG31]|uniref:Uncharacterized protein n=1 Tax=Melampsora larici-populina (strain 98AG31 / pathotype 3-4-7) TaxID=747676 RepID=F4RKF5_MELLP|nr:uncharacterized protein MELLADRAFT_62834 [Melampsora larici-populina 98AG31]EGG07087.1 hypothetical protein MELLADRAFT_62834 [Melampsora larici-populina 98AG31]
MMFALILANHFPLRVEITNLMISYYIDLFAKSPTNLIKSAVSTTIRRPLLIVLLNLRFDAKTWVITVFSYAYDKLLFGSGSVLNCIMTNWEISPTVSIASRLRHIRLDRIMAPAFDSLLALESPGFTSKPLHQADWYQYKSNSFVTKMGDIEPLPHLCQDTLTDLKLRFEAGITFTPAIIHILERAANLEVLILVGNRHGIRINHSECVQNLLKATNHVESLSLDLGYLRAIDPFWENPPCPYINPYVRCPIAHFNNNGQRLISKLTNVQNAQRSITKRDATNSNCLTFGGFAIKNAFGEIHCQHLLL